MEKPPTQEKRVFEDEGRSNILKYFENFENELVGPPVQRVVFTRRWHPDKRARGRGEGGRGATLVSEEGAAAASGKAKANRYQFHMGI